MQIHTKSRQLEILPQPTDESCGPTCLHAVYKFNNDTIRLEALIEQVKKVKGGGTLAVMLGNHALKRGYQATIYTYNLQVFDPTWFDGEADIVHNLREQLLYKKSRKLKQATRAYIEFISLGGQLRYEELNAELLKSFLDKQYPILTGLSATYLYQSAREVPETNAFDSIKGAPMGHFVVLTGVDEVRNRVFVADPLSSNPINEDNQYYSVNMDRLINAILLGIVTYDANLLIIQPK